MQSLTHFLAFLRSWISDPDDQHDRPSAAAHLAILAGVFLAARAFVIFAVMERGLPLVRSDGANYISIAESLLSTGLLPLDQRQFPGFGILIALFSLVTFMDPVVAGLVLVLVPGLLAVGLFYLLTRNFRLSLLLIFFLPGWVSSGIMSEGFAMLCLLCTFVAFGRESGPGWKRASLAMVGGLLVIIKPPLILAVLPLGAVAAWGAIFQGRRDLLIYGLLFFLPFAIYAMWAQMTIGTFRPEAAEQLRYTIEQSRGIFPERLLTWPGHSLSIGLLNPGESPIKKASVLFTILAALVGVIGLLVKWHEATPLGGTGLLLGVGLILYAVFHLSIGGPWGFNTMERYLGQVSPVILIGIFADRRPRWWLLGCAIVGSLGYTSLAGRQGG